MNAHRQRGSVELIAAGLLLVVTVSASLGYLLGKSRQASALADLQQASHACEAALSTTLQISDINAGALTGLKAKLQDERDRRQKIEQAAQAELAARGDHLAALARENATLRNRIQQEASADEDCTTLRTLPVCAAVARGLWGDAGTARPH